MSVDIGNSRPLTGERLRKPSSLRVRLTAFGGPRVETVLATAIYCAYVIWLTRPVILHLATTVYGAPGDLTGSIAQLRELVEGHHNPFGAGQRISDFNAPEGQPVDWRVNLSYWASLSVLYILAKVVGAVAAFSIFTLAGYVASALSMFLLTRKLTGNVWAALIAGWAFGFYPFVAINGQGHNFLVHGWPLVLIAWRALAFRDEPSHQNALCFGGAAILAMAWSPYLILIGGVLFGTLFAIELVVALAQHEARSRSRPLALSVFLPVAYLILLGLVTLRGGSATLREHTIQELYVYSARILEYVVPPSGNLLFGHHTGPFLTERLHGSNFSESTLYLGVTILILAVVGVVGAIARIRTDRRGVALVATFVIVGVVGVAFSAPPRVNLGPASVPTPSEFIFHITTTWRAYSRFVMLVMLAACVLAAFGLALLSRARPRIVGVALVCVAAVAVPIDLYVQAPGGRTNNLTTQPILEILKRQPPGTLAQYPLMPSGYGDYQDLFLQDFHGHPMINGFADTTQEARDLKLADLAEPDVVGRLATLGVRYLLVPKVDVQPPVQPPGRPRSRDASVIATAGYGPTTATLYRVTAKPEPIVSTSSGFSPTEGTGRQAAQWLTSPSGEIEVRDGCASCDGELLLAATSLVRSRRLAITDAAGRDLWHGVIPTGRERRVRVPLRFAHKTSLEVRSDPGTEQVPGPDPRNVSVHLRDLRYRRSPAR